MLSAKAAMFGSRDLHMYMEQAIVSRAESLAPHLQLDEKILHPPVKMQDARTALDPSELLTISCAIACSLYTPLTFCHHRQKLKADHWHDAPLDSPANSHLAQVLG